MTINSIILRRTWGTSNDRPHRRRGDCRRDRARRVVHGRRHVRGAAWRRSKPGQVWIGPGGARWSARRIGEAMPGEPLHEWRLIRRPRGDRRTTGQFGDRTCRPTGDEQRGSMTDDTHQRRDRLAFPATEYLDNDLATVLERWIDDHVPPDDEPWDDREEAVCEVEGGPPPPLRQCCPATTGCSERVIDRVSVTARWRRCTDGRSVSSGRRSSRRRSSSWRRSAGTSRVAGGCRTAASPPRVRSAGPSRSSRGSVRAASDTQIVSRSHRVPT